MRRARREYCNRAASRRPGDERQFGALFSVSALRVPGLPPLGFEVRRGGILGIAGPSGSGKTRLLRALADLDPTPGRVTLDGAERASLPAPEWRRRVGLLPAEPRYWGATVAAHFPEPPGAAAFSSLGLDPALRDADPATLSTGEKARIALLRLLARGPEALLLDEPGANLDRANRERLLSLVRNFREGAEGRPGGLVLWASHAEDELRFADAVLHLPEGTVTPATGAAR